MVDAGAVHLAIVAKLDRLTRSVKDLAVLLERFQTRGVSLWEREAIGERTKDAMAHEKASGEWVGTVPFGYRVAADGVRLESDEAQQGILTKVRALRALGLSTRKIADAVRGSGQEAKAGRKNNVIPWPRCQNSVFEQHARNLDRVANDLRRISNADHRSTLQSTMASATAVEQAALLADPHGDVTRLTDERLIELITKLRSDELRDGEDGPRPVE